MSNSFYDRERVRKYGSDLVKCKICGRFFARIGTHAVQFHGYAKADDYYAEFGLMRKEGTSGTYRKIMAEHAIENGTWKNLEKGASKRFSKGDKRIKTKEWFENRRRIK